MQFFLNIIHKGIHLTVTVSIYDQEIICKRGNVADLDEPQIDPLFAVERLCRDRRDLFCCPHVISSFLLPVHPAQSAGSFGSGIFFCSVCVSGSVSAGGGCVLVRVFSFARAASGVTTLTRSSVTGTS